MSGGDTRGKRYIVRDAFASDEPSESGIYPGTLTGLLDAMASAQARSYAGTPKVLVVVKGSTTNVIRRYESGREVPVTPG